MTSGAPLGSYELSSSGLMGGSTVLVQQAPVVPTITTSAMMSSQSPSMMTQSSMKTSPRTVADGAPMRGSAADRARSPVPHPGMAQNAIGKVRAMHAEVSLVEETLNAMQEEVAWLKERALHNKAGAIERCFMQNDKMIKQAYIHEWHVFAHMMRKIREVDGVHFAR